MAVPIDAQRRGRRIAMNPDELDAFLGDERTCRVASVASWDFRKIGRG